MLSGSLGFFILGIIAGGLGGVVGVGGGIVIVPALITLFGFHQKIAQGTSLAAILPPVGLLATYVYYKNGNVHVMAALLIAAGFLIGAFGGSLFANILSRYILQKIFGVMLLAIGAKFVFFN